MVQAAKIFDLRNIPVFVLVFPFQTSGNLIKHGEFTHILRDEYQLNYINLKRFFFSFQTKFQRPQLQEHQKQKYSNC